MNQSPIFSVPASVTTLVAFRRAKLIAAGAAYAGAGEQAVGTILPGDPGGQLQSAIQDISCGIHFATIGNATAVAIGDVLESYANGQLVKQTTGSAEAIALETASASGDVIRVKYLGAVSRPAIVASGLKAWAGGTGTTDTISVPGLLATDIVLASLTLKSGTQYLVSALANVANSTIDLTLSAAGANTTCATSYVVLRA